MDRIPRKDGRWERVIFFTLVLISFTFPFFWGEMMGMPVMISHANDGANLNLSGNTTCKSL